MKAHTVYVVWSTRGGDMCASCTVSGKFQTFLMTLFWMIWGRCLPRSFRSKGMRPPLQQAALPHQVQRRPRLLDRKSQRRRNPEKVLRTKPLSLLCRKPRTCVTSCWRKRTTRETWCLRFNLCRMPTHWAKRWRSSLRSLSFWADLGFVH